MRAVIGAGVCMVATIAFVMLAFAGSASSSEHSGLPLRAVARIALPGPSNRFDYESLDPALRRLYISHMDGNQLLVFDVQRRRVITTIGAPGVHGVLAVPRLGLVFASATNAKQVYTIDARTDSVIARAPAGDYPDGIAWDSRDRRAFVSDELGGVETVLDAHGKRIDTIPLGGEAGNVQYDAATGHILVDVQTSDAVAVIAPPSDRIIKRIPLAGCDHDHGLLIDAPRRLAFVACDGNAKLLTLDLATMRVVGAASVGSSPDVLAFDASLHRLYVAAESGVVAVFSESASGLVKLGQAFLAPYAHSVAVDPTTHLIYFPLQLGPSGRPQLLIMAPTAR